MKKSLVLLISFLILSGQILISHPSDTRSDRSNIFRAALIKIDITPDTNQILLGYKPRTSVGVHDSIFHRIMVIEDGDEQLCLVSSDLCYVLPLEYDRMAGWVSRDLGIAPDHFWWTTTHTHSAPQVGENGLRCSFKGEIFLTDGNQKYTDFVESRLLEGVRLALENLQPARLGIGWGYSLANINRRAVDVDGRAFLGFAPDKPVDHKIGILKLESIDGELLGLLANYPVHGTLLGAGNCHISGDIPGTVSSYVESVMGVPVLFINGAAGNISPIYTNQTDPGTRKLSHYCRLLGDKIIEASRKIDEFEEKVRIGTTSLVFKTPGREDLNWPDGYEKYNHTAGTGQNQVMVPLSFLNINNDIAIWAAPLELFCEMAISVRNSSPFEHTLFFGYTNGWLGYLLTEIEYKYGGYESSVSPFSPSAEKNLLDVVQRQLKGLTLKSVKY